VRALRRESLREKSRVTCASVEPESRAERIVGGFASAMNVLAAVWLLGVALIILRDVAGRELFGAPLHGTNEIVSNSVLSILLLQLPLSILNRTSLRTTIWYSALGARAKGCVDAASYLLGALLFAVIAVGSWPNMVEAWLILEREGSGVISIPVYPVRTLVVAVSAVGIAVCGLCVYRALARPGEHETL